MHLVVQIVNAGTVSLQFDRFLCYPSNEINKSVKWNDFFFCSSNCNIDSCFLVKNGIGYLYHTSQVTFELYLNLLKIGLENYFVVLRVVLRDQLVVNYFKPPQPFLFRWQMDGKEDFHFVVKGLRADHC
jgi:hypothetical protein